MELLTLHGPAVYYDVDDRLLDAELRALIDRCTREQRRAAAEAMRNYIPNDGSEVTDAALEALLAAGREIRGIATEREITNAIPFHTRNVQGVVRDAEVLRLRRAIDARVAKRLGKFFVPGEDPTVAPTGHLWYPPGGYMGWHTNSRFPGWRLYITHCPEGGRSYFRYRDPHSGTIQTSYDRPWHVRLFRVSAEQLLWHCVYAETDRFSLGYLVRPWSLRNAIVRRVRLALAPRVSFASSDTPAPLSV
ncbi:MAG TPA: hypothetical protein VNK41_06500 [Vicinamibacterales bacterium]|nr:hypothetical protein [Vicinamibacterales bacterium]